MQLNHFDSKTRIYSHSAPAMPNPKQPGKFFEQAFTTADSLPALKSNEIAVRNTKNTAWEINEDHRGYAWQTDSKVMVQITELGPLPEGLTADEPGEFDQWHNNRWVKDDAAELPARKLEALNKLSQIASEQRQSSATADHFETASWSEKARRAERFIAGMGNATDLAALQAEASARGKDEAPAELAQLQLNKASAFLLLNATIDGWLKSAGHQVSSAASAKELDSLTTELQQQLTDQLAGLQQN